MAADEIAYKIYGEDLQFVEIELDPGETVISEAGAMMYMTDGIAMQTKLGGNDDDGVFGKLLGAGKRFVTGESLFLTAYTNEAKKQIAHVSFAAPYPGRIVPLDLSALGTMMCQKESYLCSAQGIGVNLAFTKKLGAGLFGGEGFILQELVGDGLAFVHAGGMVHPLDLAAGQTLRVDTGCIVSFQQSVGYDIKFVGSVKTALFGGEGIFFAELTGPGRVYLQSLPFSRLADRVYKAMPARGGSSGEGNILGGLGLGNS